MSIFDVNMSSLLKASQISKSFGKVSVLKDLNFELFQGEFVSITGASGSGKSTLLHILGGLEHPDEGSLKFNNVDYPQSSKKIEEFRNKHLGFVFQFHHLLPEFSALENICMPGWIGKSDNVEEYARELANEFGIYNRLNHLPNKLSGGEQQRVAMARALIQRPKLLLADEPSGNLDSKRSIDLFNLLDQVRSSKSIGIVVVTHDENWASRADRTLNLKDGKWEV
jgi:lipoprotein-releasing system ATP-binding protein